jgi:hypothetical protein
MATAVTFIGVEGVVIGADEVTFVGVEELLSICAEAFCTKGKQVMTAKTAISANKIVAPPFMFWCL